MDSKQWFREAKFGVMVHWGLYSLFGGEWKGKRMKGGYGEWSQSYFQIPNTEYEQLAKAFNPVFFNAEEWVKLAKDSGAQYFVVTSKHHEGFCMYHSKVDRYNVVNQTPFGRDVIDEIGEACYKHGMKLGLYYSQALDWHEEHGGGYDEKVSVCAGTTWDNSWDFPDRSKKDYSICFENKIKPQVKEILTNYGDLCLIWFDTPYTITKEQSRELFDMVKQYQPDCLVNSRIGNGLGDYTSTPDNDIPDDCKESLYESPLTLNDTWGYEAFDQNWKSTKRLAEIKKHLNERNINFLINLGPDHLGRIPGPSADILRGLRDYI